MLDAAGASSPVLFGCAEGAQIAALYSAIRPDRVRALVTYALWSHVPADERASWEQYLEWAPPR